MSCTAISRTVAPTDARTQRSTLRGFGIERARELLQQRFRIERRLRGPQSLLQPLHGVGETRRARPA